MHQTTFLRGGVAAEPSLGVGSELPSCWILSHDEPTRSHVKAGLGSRERVKKMVNTRKLMNDPHSILDNIGERIIQKHFY